VDVSVGLERVADRADAPVHHVGGRDDVGAGLGMGAGLAYQGVDGDVVHHVALGIDDAVLTVGGEGVQRDVGDHAQFGQGRLQGPHRPLGQAVGIPGLGRVQALLLRGNHREQGQGGDAQFQADRGLAQQLVHAQAFDPRHRCDRLAPALALADEDGIDQVVGGQPVLAHQAAREGVAAHAPGAHGGKGSGGLAHDFGSSFSQSRGFR